MEGSWSFLTVLLVVVIVGIVVNTAVVLDMFLLIVNRLKPWNKQWSFPQPFSVHGLQPVPADLQ